MRGEETEKPGWTRLNFSVLMDNAKADAIIAAIDGLARDPMPTAALYVCDGATARFSAQGG